MKPTRRALLKAGAAAAAVGCGPRGDAGRRSTDTGKPPGRPNVIYLYADQVRWDAAGFAGNPVAVTPNLDALARDAVRFSNAITNGPSCRAARASMMTGLPVWQHGVDDNFAVPDPSLQSHVRRMRDEAGYHTMVVGKTHLHDGDTHMDEYKGLLAEWGFADAIELPDPQEWWWESAHSDYLTATTPAGERDKYARWQEYVQAYHWTSDAPDQDPWKLATEDHLDSFCGQAAADFVRAWDGRAPLYLQVCFPGPHKPFDPTTEFLSKYDPDDPAMPLPNLLPPQPPIAPLVEQYMGPKFEPWDLAGARALRAHYYGKLSLVDAALGQVIQALKDQGLYDSSWIVFHSDHGELLADHSLTGKVLAYEGAIRVPLLVKPPSWTGAEVGWEDPGQVDQLDVTSTLLAIGGLDPTGYGDRDLTDRALGGPDGPLVGEDKPAMFENLGTVGIRDGALTMSWDLELGHPVELYDRDQDPDQVENRVADPALREDLDRLVTVLRSLRPLDKDEWNP